MKASDLCRACAPRGRRSRTSHNGRLGWAERANYGLIATLRNKDGVVKVRQGWGRPQQAIEEIATWIDARPKEQWRVLTLSSPMSILSDLTRDLNHVKAAGLLPELSVLGRARRLDLLAPEDVRMTSRTKRC